MRSERWCTSTINRPRPKTTTQAQSWRRRRRQDIHGRDPAPRLGAQGLRPREIQNRTLRTKLGAQRDLVTGAAAGFGSGGWHMGLRSPTSPATSSPYAADQKKPQKKLEIKMRRKSRLGRQGGALGSL